MSGRLLGFRKRKRMRIAIASRIWQARYRQMSFNSWAFRTETSHRLYRTLDEFVIYKRAIRIRSSFSIWLERLRLKMMYALFVVVDVVVFSLSLSLSNKTTTWNSHFKSLLLLLLLLLLLCMYMCVCVRARLAKPTHLPQ